ncbi:BON domain-containing protein [Flavobacterium terrisoli]|uniref:BON domain-containing protein n=1 Tax=Flavobacterium terrisoli TaxID=3242195 RepID=UPI002542DC40|nr:BON domain-containing protein [Flavobacterium buctense]
MGTDAILKQQIEKALQSNTMLNSAEFEVMVQNGCVALTGYTDKYYKKEMARKIAKEVQGVKTVTEEITIVLNDNVKCSDTEIEFNISEKFRKNFGNSHKDIKIIVNDGYVRLEGQLKWKYQKDLANECIQYVMGIKQIVNNISIPETRESVISEKDVFAAIYGDPSIITEIKIEIFGQRVILKGKVHNVEQKNLVTRLVRNVPKVKEIENFLTIDKNYEI